MDERIKDKSEEIVRFLEQLEEITPKDYGEYERDFKTKAACERYFEKIVEACEDLAFLILREKSIKIPEKEESVFFILYKNNLINEDLYKKLKEAKGMRNIISHQYGNINDEIVFESITSQLIKDIEEFMEKIV
ncbi:MAG: DUF86 domain-containing protein [Nanoarchaeota archaeon]